jgi:hypothetical protein
VRADRAPPSREIPPAGRRSLKTQQRERLAVSARCIEVDVIPGEFTFWTAILRAINRVNAYRSNSSGIP